MQASDSSAPRALTIKRYAIVLAAAWSVIMAGVLIWHLSGERDHIRESARIQASQSFEKDLIYRRWAAGHGGVYVPVTDETPPNPYLAHVEDRDITTPSGRKLTLINPAYMTRQVHDLEHGWQRLQGHITSLNPIRPENTPDPWEAEALRAFERGETEVASLELIEGQQYTRLMRPLFTEEGCLKCHAEQGYELGDLRGGISVSVPMAPLWAVAYPHMAVMALRYALIWLLGLGGIAMGAGRLRQRVRERAQANQALRESEERLRQSRDYLDRILNAVYDGVAVIGRDYRILDVNDCFLKVYNGTREEIIGRTCHEIAHRSPKPCTDAGHPCPLDSVFESGQLVRVEHRHQDHDSTDLIIEVSAFPLFGPDGEVESVVELSHDVTEHRRAAQELRRERDKAKQYLDIAGVILVAIDDRGEVTLINKKGCELLGERDDEIIGKDWFGNFIPERLRKDLIPVSEKLLSGELDAAEYHENPILTKSGEERMIAWHNTILKDDDGNIVGHLSSGEDITERKQAEEALRASEGRYRALFNVSADGILIADSETRHFRHANPALCRMLGYSEHELTRLGVTDIHPKESLERVVAEFEAQTRGQKMLAENIPCLRKDGTVLYADIATTTAEIEGRECVVGLFRDITERKQAEAELEKLHRELVEASRQAGMSEVAAGVLHNIGNVLNSVNVSAGLVNEKIRGSRIPGLAKATALMSEHADDLGVFITRDERGRQLPGYLTKLAEHLAGEQTDVLGELRHLTENIEHIKNIVSMQQSLSGMSGVTEPVRIGDLLDDLLKMDAASFDHCGVKVVREYDEHPVATIDKHKLMQILVNLLKNAKDALTEDQGPDKRLTVRLRWVPRAACLPVCAVATDPTALADKPPVALDHVQIEVADNAVGIPPENLTKIFIHGFTTKEDGHGFGLHGSALAAKELGGSLTAHSDGPGQGATFTLDLPLQVTEKSDVC